MQLKTAFTILYLCVLCTTSWTQIHPCGTSSTTFKQIEKRLIENKAYLKDHPAAYSRNATTYIPVKFHLVADTDGTGRVEYGRVLDQLCLMNEVFQEFDISFYIKDGFNEVNDSDINSSQMAFSTRSRMRSHRDSRALNIWVLEEITTGNDAGTVLGVYDADNDWVRVTSDRTYFGINGYTLPHEIGHFFSLLHPFYGWEIEPYSQQQEGKPAPRSAPNFNVLSEYKDGTNCEEAGDRICDTPADYLYSIYVDSRGDTVNNMNNSTCQYDRPMTDPKGERLMPDASLIMGYFLDNCMDHFTSDQIDVMQADLARGSRAYLRSNYLPAEGAIAGSATLIAPLNSEVSNNYNWVPFSWEKVDNAVGYLVEVSRVPGFSDNPLNYITYTNAITIKDLVADRSYFWRVTAFNNDFTCAAPSSRGRFKTGLSTAISTIKKVDRWNVSPNPTTSEKGVVLTVSATAAFTADLKIYSLTGQLLQTTSKVTFDSGKSSTFVDLHALPSGIYLVHLENETGILNKKLVVSE